MLDRPFFGFLNLNNMINLEDFKEKKIKHSDLTPYEIDKTLIESLGISVKELYPLEEATKIVVRKSLKLSIELFCKNEDLIDNCRKFKFLEGVDYIGIDIRQKDGFMPAFLPLFQAYLDNLLVMPFAVRDSNTLFLSLKGLNWLLEFSKAVRTCKKKEPEHPLLTYVMYDRISDCYKIGRSRCIEHREKTLAAQKPNIKTILYSDSAKEYEMHQIFRAKKIRGEWFRLNADDVLALLEKYGFKKWKRL
jgi:hypothetical protein